MSRIDGRVALVTGGATLIGQGVVMALRAEGATVVVVDIDAAGELTKCLHPLGATGFVEQLPARGYVHH